MNQVRNRMTGGGRDAFIDGAPLTAAAIVDPRRTVVGARESKEPAIDLFLAIRRNYESWDI